MKLATLTLMSLFASVVFARPVTYTDCRYVSDGKRTGIESVQIQSTEKRMILTLDMSEKRGEKDLETAVLRYQGRNPEVENWSGQSWASRSQRIQKLVKDDQELRGFKRGLREVKPWITSTLTIKKRTSNILEIGGWTASVHGTLDPKIQHNTQLLDGFWNTNIRCRARR